MSYPRSVRTPRGEARRAELLEKVTDDLSAHGLVDFSLRRAARAAGTTHKVLLYHFADLDDLLLQAVLQLRDRRIARAAQLRDRADDESMAAWVLAVWDELLGEESRVLDQAIGLMLYDPDRYSALGRGASQQYLPTILAACPDRWSDRRRLEVAEMVLAALRGFLIDRLSSGDDSGVRAGLAALARAISREEKAIDPE
jgi:AcrR family transcriptional regulator